MSRFVDEYMPEKVPGFPCISSPRWSTDIQIVDSGAERVNQRWEHPLHTFTLPDAIRTHDVFEGIHDQWLAMRGPLHSFPFRDPLDFASVSLETPNFTPALSRTDQIIGTADGVVKTFQLVKEYARGVQTYTRKIYHPVVDTVIIGVDGIDPLVASPPLTWSVDRNTGIVTFDEAPSPGQVITAGFLYDVEVRFESDDTFDGVVRTYSVSGFADIVLTEIRPCV